MTTTHQLWMLMKAADDDFHVGNYNPASIVGFINGHRVTCVVSYSKAGRRAIGHKVKRTFLGGRSITWDRLVDRLHTAAAI